MKTGSCILVALVVFASPCSGEDLPSQSGPAVEELAREIHEKGWIAYSARSENGTWDLFLSRPDGSDRLNITNTPDYEEAAPRFSFDGGRMLYRRMEKGTTLDHDRWGFQGTLVLAQSDGRDPAPQGEEGEYSWASWSPDGKQIVSLTKKGIQFVDLESKQVVRSLPRNGIYQQLFLSPDGQWLCGVANHAGESWTVVRMDAETGETNPLRKFQNCTPDWFPDSRNVILSSRPPGQAGNNGYGYTQLWRVNGEGGDQHLLFGEDGVHIYGGTVSPDGQYLLFSKCPEDGGGAEKSGGTLFLMRLADSPTIAGESADLRKLHPQTKQGPVLEIGKGWEPDWTASAIGGTR